MDGECQPTDLRGSVEEKGFEKRQTELSIWVGKARSGQCESGEGVYQCVLHERVLWEGKLVWKQMAEKLL